MSALKIAVSVLTTQVEAALLKMCKGFGGVDATREDIWLMSSAVEGYGQGQEGERLLVKVKALGGSRTFEALLEMFKIGVELVSNVNFLWFIGGEF